MKSCWGVRGRRWRGIAALFSAAVGLGMLQLTTAQAVGSPAECSANNILQNAVQHNYSDVVELAPSGANFMAGVVHSFLACVQPSPFPEDLILTAIKNGSKVLSNQEFIQQVLKYEAGFLVCAAIGIVYIILMPIIFIFLVCCNCGNNMHPKDTHDFHRRRTIYSCSILVTTIFLFAGNVCMFNSNQMLKSSVYQSQAKLEKTIENVNNFTSAIPKDAQYIFEEGNRIIENFENQINDFGNKLGQQIWDRVKKNELEDVMKSVSVLDEEMKNMQNQLESLNKLQSSMEKLEEDMKEAAQSIQTTLSDPVCQNCNELEKKVNVINTNIPVLPSTEDFQSSLGQDMDLNSKIDEMESTIQNEISTGSADKLTALKQPVSQVKNKTTISWFMGQLEKAEDIRWGVSLVLCLLVFLLILSNILALVLGPLGLKQKVDPLERSCMADSAGKILIISANINFIFSWLLMVVTLLLCLIGGNVYTLVCRPWSNGELWKFIQTPGLIPGLNSSNVMGRNITLEGIYRDCGENKPAWQTFHLDKDYNITEMLDIDAYIKKIEGKFENIPAPTIPNFDVVTVLLPQFSTIPDMDLESTMQQMSDAMGTLSNQLASIANLIDGLAPYQGPEIKSQLQNHAKVLRGIQSRIEKNIIPQINKGKSTAKALKFSVKKVKDEANVLDNELQTAPTALTTKMVAVIKEESIKFLNCQLSPFTEFVKKAKTLLTEELGRCGPIAGFVDSTESILCADITESLNAFWFSLGWCVAFSILCVFLARKLSTYYKRSNYSTDDMNMYGSKSTAPAQSGWPETGPPEPGPQIRPAGQRQAVDRQTLQRTRLGTSRRQSAPKLAKRRPALPRGAQIFPAAVREDRPAPPHKPNKVTTPRASRHVTQQITTQRTEVPR
ncbi:prominin-1-A-like isoform X2 [Entelurus aequoreus]|uniref:prominin-1-A-like isoform X2 n=1 Tax=Entelurus aequoreus TaxID=161455 RepID=UPI002B1E0815|nr:prominin-1-A-like isoform X2 [Entelurus aequoreus]